MEILRAFLSKNFLKNIIFIFFISFSINLITVQNLKSAEINIQPYQVDTLKSQGVLFTYPTPDELLEIIKKDKITFYGKFLNPVENESKYIDSKYKNLNLGVYMADLAYSAFFEKRSRILKLIENISKLSEDLLISNDLKTNLKADLERNIENLDSIYHLTSAYYNKIMMELEKNHNNKVMVIISTGAYIESVYLSLSTIDKFTEQNNVINKIAEQKNAFIDLHQTSKLYANELYVKDVIKYQETLINHYRQFKVENKGKFTLSTNKDGTVTFKSAEKVIMNKEQFEDFKKVVTIIRNEITKNSK